MTRKYYDLNIESIPITKKFNISFILGSRNQVWFYFPQTYSIPIYSL